MPENPFKAAVLALIRESPAGLSEYDLMQRLEERDPAFARDREEPGLALFRKHFLVMNALYRLQAELFEEGWYLSVSPLAIRLEPAQALGLTRRCLPAARKPLCATITSTGRISSGPARRT